MLRKGVIDTKSRENSLVKWLLRLWVRIPPGAWMFFCCEWCMMSGRCLCDELITRPEESYRLWSVVVCDPETLWIRRPWPTEGCRAKNKQLNPNLMWAGVQWRCDYLLPVGCAVSRKRKRRENSALSSSLFMGQCHNIASSLTYIWRQWGPCVNFGMRVKGC